MFLQTRQDRKLCQHFKRTGRTCPLFQFGPLQQLVVNLGFLCHPQAIGDLDHADTVDKGFVVFVGLEGLPLGLVRVRQNKALERDRTKVFGADIVAFLCCRQQRMQHLDRGLEHLDKFKKSLIGAVKPAGIAVRIRVILAVIFKFADIDLADQRRNILIVFITRLGFGNRNLTQARRDQFNDREFGKIAVKFIKPFHRPW